MLEASLDRSRRRIVAVGSVDPSCVDRVRAALAAFDPDALDVPSIPFLHDTTTKNVIVSDGALSGIVDVDDLCFGDPLLTIGLTRMSLLNMGVDTDYVEAWLRYRSSRVPAGLLDLYSAIFCVDFLGEQGQRFNRARAPEVDLDTVSRLSNILDELLRRLGM